MSRGAINHRTKDSQNFEKLQKESPCDNLLLEWRLALEAKKRGMVEAIFPVMVGDMDTNAVYNNYMRSNCGPTAVPDVVVDSIEGTLRENLEREGLGLPFDDALTVKAVYDAVLSNQGRFVEGDLSASVATIVDDILQIKDRVNERSLQRYKSKLRDDPTFPAKQARLQAKLLTKLGDENKDLILRMKQITEERTHVQVENDQLRQEVEQLRECAQAKDELGRIIGENDQYKLEVQQLREALARHGVLLL